MAEGNTPLFNNELTGQRMPIIEGILSGEITTDLLADEAVTTAKIDDAAVTNAKLANMAAWTIKMRNNAAAGVPQDQTINDLTTETPDGTADFFPFWDNSASVMRKGLLSRTGGLQLLTSGSVSLASTLDIVLTDYTAFKGILFVLRNLVPNTDNVNFLARFSSNGGSSYDSGGTDYNYALNQTNSNGGAVNGVNSAGASSIFICGNSTNLSGVGSDNTEGLNMILNLINQTGTTRYPKMSWNGQFLDATAPTRTGSVVGAGVRLAAQDTDAVRFLFSSDSIANGDYAVYGYT